MRKVLALILFAATAVPLGGCHYGHQSYGFNYSSGYSPAYYCDPVVVHHHHGHFRSHRGWGHCH